MLESERLRDRMADMEISQSELARRVGVSQATIFKLVSGKLYGSKYLHKIARELGTTSEYLMGETDDPDSNTPDAPTLSYEQLELIEYHARLSRADQQILIQLARSMAEKSPPATPRLHDAPVGFKPEGK